MRLLRSKFVNFPLTESDSARVGKGACQGYLNKYSFSIPLLMTDEGEIVREMHSFLLEKEIYSRSVTKTKTVETYSESLLHWLCYCESNGLDWRKISNRSLIFYRNSMKQKSLGRSKVLCASTINLRMTVVVEFLKYYFSELVETDSSHETILRRLDKLNRARFSVRESIRNPIALSPLECQRLSARLQSPHRLIFSWGLSTGLRIGTLLSIKLDDYYTIKGRFNGGFLEVLTKGGKKQKIFVPQDMIHQTNRYIEVERKLKILRVHNRISQSDTDMLFVNQEGRAVSRECYYSAYKRASRFLGIDSHPHQARTTFATFIEKSLRAYGAANGIDHIKIVQGLLGHASSDTTMSYLEGLRINDADVLALLELNSNVLGGRHG